MEFVVQVIAFAFMGYVGFTQPIKTGLFVLGGYMIGAAVMFVVK